MSTTTEASGLRYRLGFDIGGTFTDLVLIDERTGQAVLGKTLTTPDDPSRGVSKGLSELFAQAGVEASDVAIAIHATTLITNALIERKGAKTALLATRGFRDTLEMATELRYDNYAIAPEIPTPLVPRQLRFDIPERLLADGRVALPLDEDAVRHVARQLKKDGVTAVAIVFLHSFRNPMHEERAREILLEEVPGLAVSCSSSVSPMIREYERTSTTTANAYVQPIVRDYLDTTQGRLRDAGYERDLYIMVSSGGVAGTDTVKHMPIRMLESGPAAGVLSALHFARHLGTPDLVTFDMGGTTAKIGVIKGYAPKKANEFEFARASRFARGSGLPANIPLIELIEIGAGGGSIASQDRMGLLAVGPHSAGSSPGPACYGLGGTQPTVTDANLVLGYLDPGNFLGGAMRLDTAAARAAFEEKLCGALGNTAEDAARGVFDVVNHNMLSAARVHIAERGLDPRSLYLYAFGGAGPVHAYELARALRMKGVIIPPGAGAASAYGLVASPMAFDLFRSAPHRLDTAEWAEIGTVFDHMRHEGRAILEAAGGAEVADAARLTYQMDMRHLGQGREMTVEVPEALVAAGDLLGICALFYRRHEEEFGHVHRDLPVELMSCRLTVSGPEVKLPIAEAEPVLGSVAHPIGTRPVYFPELGAYTDAAIYEREGLLPGMSLTGPAVVQERECTITVGPAATATVNRIGALVIDIGPNS